jgi:lycopene cyclase domain-containing protein
MNFLYLGGLLVSITGMIVLDRRFRLFFWLDARRASIVMVVGLVFFFIWDAVGVAEHIFFPGTSPVDTGWMLAPGIPVEEFFFLTLLCYLTMNLYEAVSRVVNHFYREAGK